MKERREKDIVTKCFTKSDFEASKEKRVLVSILGKRPGSMSDSPVKLVEFGLSEKFEMVNAGTYWDDTHGIVGDGKNEFLYEGEHMKGPVRSVVVPENFIFFDGSFNNLVKLSCLNRFSQIVKGVVTKGF